jgi:phosphatidylinositol alpha-mannosyltransferase
MRILQVCPYAWSARGGVQAHIRQLSSHLSSRGHQVLVLSAGRLEARDRARSTVSRTDLIVANGAPRVQIVGPYVRVPFNGSIAPLCLHGSRTVRKTLACFQPDIVHVHELMAPSLPTLAAMFARVPVVATFHANCTSALGSLMYSAAARCLRPIARRVAVRLAVSQAAASCAAPRVGGSVRIIPNGIDIEPFASAKPMALPPGRKLLFVNRLDRRKGIEVALRAFEHLSARFDDLLFVICGDGPRRTAADALPASIRRRVLMLGDIPDAHLPSAYAAADVFVAPATGQESFGVVLLEAMAAGVPIVATDIEGYREVVRAGTHAVLVPPGDAASLAAGIQRVLESPLLARRLVAAGRRRVRRFAWSLITDEIEHTYDLALETAALTAAAQERVPLISFSR